MICEDMICEKCATEGKTSRVRNTHIVKTLGAYLPFYDEQGRQHFHDANMTNAEYRCTNGHVWHTRGTGSCWCGWPNEQKATSAEPAAISTSPTKTRRFTVYRRGDLSETHNANQVNPADQPQYEGVVFSDGTTVVRWLTAARSTSVWVDFETLWKVHGHDDPNSKHGTVIVWHDEANAPYRVINTNHWSQPPVDGPTLYTRQQVEAMLRIALTDRTDEWTLKPVDERVAALLSMFTLPTTKEKP